jgi:hypothetical protein
MTALHCTALHPTAQHTTPQHSIEQSAQHSIAQASSLDSTLWTTKGSRDGRGGAEGCTRWGCRAVPCACGLQLDRTDRRTHGRTDGRTYRTGQTGWSAQGCSSTVRAASHSVIYLDFLSRGCCLISLRSEQPPDDVCTEGGGKFPRFCPLNVFVPRCSGMVGMGTVDTCWGWMCPSAAWYGHTTANAPDPIRTRKPSAVGPE